MKFWDIFMMCAANLWRRKVRTMLTICGVIIGTCSIVVMISLGVGIGESQTSWIDEMGDLTIITVYPDWQSEEVTLNDEMVDTISAIADVEVATPFYYLDTWGALILQSDERYRYQGQVVGVKMDALEALGYEAAEGRLFHSEDSKYSAVFGSSAAYQFLDTKRKRNNMVDSWPDENGRVKDPFVDPLEDDYLFMLVDAEEGIEYEAIPEKEADGEYLDVVGVLQESNDGNWQFDKSYTIYIDLHYAQELMEMYYRENDIRVSQDNQKTYDQVYVKASSVDTVTAVEEEIQALGGLQTSSMVSMREENSEQMMTIQLALGGIGGVSMLVAALSITNTMVMSIYERTREIGVMKVLGCRLGNIRTLFLGEAALIGLIGGILGIGLSYGISTVVNIVLASLGGDMNLSVIPIWLIFVGLGFATAVGLLSGFYPANRAVRISAIEAIRHE